MDLNLKLSVEGVDEDEVMKTHYEIGIVRRFDFSSKLQRMSVLVKNVNEPYFKIYSKGEMTLNFRLTRENKGIMQVAISTQ